MARRTILLTVAAVLAVLGVALVYVYVRGADDRALADQTPVQVLVAKDRIPAGTTVADAARAGAFEKKSIPDAAVTNGALSDLSPITGEIALSTIYPGQQIIAAQFGKPGTVNSLILPDDGTQAATFTFSDSQRVAGFVQPGSTVAVYLSTSKETRLLLPKVRVLAIGTRTIISGNAGGTDSGGKALVTFALTQQQAQKLILAQRSGDLYLGLLGEKSAVGSAAATNPNNLFG